MIGTVLSGPQSQTGSILTLTPQAALPILRAMGTSQRVEITPDQLHLECLGQRLGVRLPKEAAIQRQGDALKITAPPDAGSILLIVPSSALQGVLTIEWAAWVEPRWVSVNEAPETSVVTPLALSFPEGALALAVECDGAAGAVRLCPGDQRLAVTTLVVERGTLWLAAVTT